MLNLRWSGPRCDSTALFRRHPFRSSRLENHGQHGTLAIPKETRLHQASSTKATPAAAIARISRKGSQPLRERRSNWQLLEPTGKRLAFASLPTCRRIEHSEEVHLGHSKYFLLLQVQIEPNVGSKSRGFTGLRDSRALEFSNQQHCGDSM